MVFIKAIKKSCQTRVTLEANSQSLARTFSSLLVTC
jgi:hypothetical protein